MTGSTHKRGELRQVANVVTIRAEAERGPAAGAVGAARPQHRVGAIGLGTRAQQRAAVAERAVGKRLVAVVPGA